MIKFRLHISIFILLFSCLTVFGQTKKELEEQRKRLKKEIVQVNNLLFKEQKREKNVLEDLKDLPTDERALANKLKSIGPIKQANVILIVTNINDPNYRYAVEESWLGGKKNDIIVLVGESNGTIVWSDVITLGGNSGNELTTVKIKQELLNNRLDISIIDKVSDLVMKHFDRKPMKDFEYLKDQIEPPTWVTILCYFISVFLGWGLTYCNIKNNIT